MIDISFKLISAAHPYEQFNIVVRCNVAQVSVSVPESPCMVHFGASVPETYYTNNQPLSASQTFFSKVISVSYIFPHPFRERFDAKWMQ